MTVTSLRNTNRKGVEIMMSGCCEVVIEKPQAKNGDFVCPHCGDKGKTIKIITLKSLLVPEALVKLEPNTNYKMCRSQECTVVYYNDLSNVFFIADLKVPVSLKSDDEDCPVCYCFGWTEKKLKSEIRQTGASTAISAISAHIKAGRCGCDVNNPEGSCCLGNVKRQIDSFNIRV